MTTLFNGLKGFNTTEEMTLFLFNEVRRTAKRQTSGKWFDAEDLESYLMIKVWTAISNNVNLQNEAGIRRVIKLRSIDFFKSPKNNGRDFSFFSDLESSDDEGNSQSFEECFASNQTSVEDTVINGNDGQGFLSTLSDVHRQILELKMDGYNQKDICSIVYPTLSYEGARKSVQRQMKAITELALDYGFEDIY